MGFLSRIYPNLIPNGILARFALIICAPIIICEIITIYIFYDKVWFSVSGHISKMITSQIQVVLMEYKEGDLTSLVKYSRLFNIRMEE
ncbi:MAG: hypothetical protein EB127_15225, partial [Alphaproteobacteria bacterium]|nr:hypothetical protein [Alphaproteobacteria bacterium]